MDFVFRKCLKEGAAVHYGETLYKCTRKANEPCALKQPYGDLFFCITPLREGILREREKNLNKEKGKGAD